MIIFSDFFDLLSNSSRVESVDRLTRKVFSSFVLIDPIESSKFDQNEGVAIDNRSVMDVFLVVKNVEREKKGIHLKKKKKT